MRPVSSFMQYTDSRGKMRLNMKTAAALIFSATGIESNFFLGSFLFPCNVVSSHLVD